MVEIFFLNILITVCFCESTTTPAHKVYVDVSDNATLQCSLDNFTGASWIGPCEPNLSNCRSSEIKYFDGLLKSPDIGKSISLRTNESRNMTETLSYDLHILYITSEYIGNYTCTELKKDFTSTTKYQILFKVKPENISIINSTRDGRLIGREGKQVDLVCLINSGIPEENITWYNEQNVVLSGGPGTLRHSFIAGRSDNGRTFTCEVQSETLEEPLMQTVTLDIHYKPRVSVGDRNMSVIEGTNFTVLCMTDSNPPTSLIQIKRGDFVVKTCATPSCNLTRTSSRQDSGSYVCTAQNQVGEGSEKSDVNVLFPPNVTILMTNEITLHCKAEGNPMKTIYLSWKHLSDHGSLIRTFPGSEFLRKFSSSERFRMNGVYVCEAANGIPDSNGKNSTFGNLSVSQTSVPEILPVTQKIQYGSFRKPSTIRLDLYSVSNLIYTTLHTNRTINDGIEIIRDNISVKIFGKNTVITGYKISYMIKNPTESDFTDYTFVFRNSNGLSNYTVNFKAKETPTAPSIDAITVDGNDIKITFRRNFDGGLLQTFSIEYRSVFILNWTRSILINDTFDEYTTYRIKNLKFDTEYCIRIHSFNDVGTSNASDRCSIRTHARKDGVTRYIALCIGILLVLSIASLVYYKGRLVVKWLARKFNPQEFEPADLGDQHAVVDVVVQNQMYLSFDSLPRASPRQANNRSAGNFVSYRPQRELLGDNNLHYADLEFNTTTQQFFIRGEDRTIYSEIDHTLTAPPLESSDSEKDDDQNEDDDDFMTLEGIADYMKERGIIPPFDE